MTSSVQGPSDEMGEKIKRPMNAFILWSRERRRELANEDPNMHNFEISKRLGIEWNRLDAKEKKHFYDEANKLKEEHRKNYPDYKYHPRRKPRRRFTPINPSSHFRMAYLLPQEYMGKGYPYQSGCPTFHRNSHNWFTNTVFPSIPSTSTDTSFLHNPQLEMRYYPQSHFVMNGGIPIPATYYGLHEIPGSLSVQPREGCTSAVEGKEHAVDMLSRFTPSALLKREELLRRAAESSLEYRMQTAGKEQTTSISTEEDLETRKHTVKYHDTSEFHRQMSSAHVCFGCQGCVSTLYRGIRSASTAASSYQ